MKKSIKILFVCLFILSIIGSIIYSHIWSSKPKYKASNVNVSINSGETEEVDIFAPVDDGSSAIMYDDFWSDEDSIVIDEEEVSEVIEESDEVDDFVLNELVTGDEFDTAIVKYMLCLDDWNVEHRIDKLFDMNSYNTYKESCEEYLYGLASLTEVSSSLDSTSDDAGEYWFDYLYNMGRTLDNTWMYSYCISIPKVAEESGMLEFSYDGEHITGIKKYVQSIAIDPRYLAE